MESSRSFVTRDDLAALFDALRDSGYTLVGPTVREESITCDVIDGIDDLPAGLTDEQDAGRYRLRQRADQALFGYTAGSGSWRTHLQQPVLTLWQARRTDAGFSVETVDETPPRMAFIGVRPCDLQAIAVQDRVLADSDYADTDYTLRRRDLFIIAVQCGQAGNTCFCVSMQTGPRTEHGFDLAITEIIDGEMHGFVVETGSAAGADLIARLPHRPASAVELDMAQAATQRASEQMGRTLDTDGIRDLLYRNVEHPRWDEVAARCLACANCTLVCPTCFCTAVEDFTDLEGNTAMRRQRWDSCFHSQHSAIHGGIIRHSTRSRYRQWLTHKLASWHDQFGTSGCTGCGRCITWCPAGIDITEEVAAIRASDGYLQEK